ncbi:MAG: CNP1-like family protein [Hydrogenophaga sp.]|uniref:CNP1-like family protein n=1 Tax=Hydrogenophaga sp. TaxID=1904254 RepID=UPI003D14900C
MTIHHSMLPIRAATLGRAALLALTCLGAANIATAADEEDPPWQEKATAAPKSFDVAKLQHFTVTPDSSLVYGIDPATLTVGEDWVVRYVMVARSSSGAINAFYEGIRCQTAEVKTYARWDNNRSAWHTATSGEWKALAASGPTRPATVLAMEGLCNGRSVNGNPRKMLATLKTGTYLHR